MTLTLEQVRQTRFHLARRNGYEPVDVDNFVDQVEATLGQLTEENDTLKQQLETLSSSEPSGIYVPHEGGEDPQVESLRQELEHSQATIAELQAALESRSGQDSDHADQLAAHQAAAEQQGADHEALTAELGQARAELEGRSGELEALRGELAARDQALAQSRGELEGARSQLAQLRAELESAQSAAQPVPVADVPTGKVENIVVTAAPEASTAVTKLLQMATEQSERLVGDAQVEAGRLVAEAQSTAEQTIDEANRKAHEAMTDARTRAERIESEARVNAERVTSEAQSRADAVNGEVERRRTELFSALEGERDDLRGKVDHLRSFEGRFRENITKHLQSQIDSLSGSNFVPDDTPDILGQEAGASSTPRLDALLGDVN